MEKLGSALYQWIVLHTNYFNFVIFIQFVNQITLKPNPTQNLKTFIMCFATGLKFWDEFNANFVLPYFSSYSSIKMWHLYLKNIDKNNKAVHLRLVLTYLF